jgi:hypothetical protein
VVKKLLNVNIKRKKEWKDLPGNSILWKWHILLPSVALVYAEKLELFSFVTIKL